MDMGTGCGIIPFLWLRKPKPEKIECLDIQQNAVDQVNRSIVHNSLQARLTVHHCDLRQIRQSFPAEGFSLVTMNPPYKPVGTGIESLGESAKSPAMKFAAISRMRFLPQIICLNTAAGFVCVTVRKGLWMHWKLCAATALSLNGFALWLIKAARSRFSFLWRAKKRQAVYTHRASAANKKRKRQIYR